MDYKQQIEKMAITYNRHTNKVESDSNDLDGIDWSNYSDDMPDSVWGNISTDMDNYLNTHPNRQEFINEHNYNSARDKVRNPNIKPDKYTKREALIGGLAPIAIGGVKGVLKGKDTKSKVLGGIKGAVKGAPLGLITSTIGAISGSAKDSRLDEEYKNKNFGESKHDIYYHMSNDLNKYMAGKNYGYNTDKEANMDYNQQIEKIAKSRYMKYLDSSGSDEELTRRATKLGIDTNAVNNAADRNSARRVIKNTFNFGEDSLSRIGEVNSVARYNSPLIKKDADSLKDIVKYRSHIHNGSPFKKLRETESKILSNKQRVGRLKNLGKNVAIGAGIGTVISTGINKWIDHKNNKNNNQNNKEANMDYKELIEKMAADETNEGKVLSSRDQETDTRFWRDRFGPEFRRGLITAGATAIPNSIYVANSVKKRKFPFASKKSLAAAAAGTLAVNGTLRAYDTNKLSKKYTGEKATFKDHALTQGGAAIGSVLSTVPLGGFPGLVAQMGTTPESVIQKKRRMLESEEEQTKSANEYMNYTEKIAANEGKILSSRDQETDTRFWRDRFGPEFRRGLVTAGITAIPTAAYSAKAIKNGKLPFASKKSLVAQAVGGLAVNGGLRAYDTNKLSKKYTGENATLEDHALAQGGAIGAAALARTPGLYGLGGLAGGVANLSTTPEAVIQRKRRMLESQEDQAKSANEYMNHIEKIAATNRDDETETRFFRDRFVPELKRDLITVGATGIPAAIHFGKHIKNGTTPSMKSMMGYGAATLGINGALRANSMNKLSKKYTGEKATFKDHALTQAGGVAGMGLTPTGGLGLVASLATTPEAMIQKKRRMIQSKDYKKIMDQSKNQE